MQGRVIPTRPEGLYCVALRADEIRPY